MSQTVLEVNGKRYNAITGELLDAPKAQYTVPKTSNGHSIDGFTVPKPLSPTHTTVHNHSAAHSPRKATMNDITVSRRHKLQKSQTLMRKTVTKPIQNHHVTVTAHQSVNPSRNDRALLTPTHPAVSKFKSTATQKSSSPTVTHLPVAHPVQNPQLTAPIPNTAPKLTAESFISQQLSKDIAAQDLQKSSTKKDRLGFLRSKKAVSLSASALAVLALAGFITWQNMPSISVAVAGKKSGLSVHVPKGVPSNFALSREVIYSKGEVTFAYKSRVDDRHFTITTQNSQDMTSQSLESAIALNTKGNYQTYQADGITLFITGPGVADWIDGGQRFNVSGESGLSSEQLATIASSL